MTVLYSGQSLLGLSKKTVVFFDKRIAVCCAHNLPADGGQIPHWQTEKYFLSRTCRERKCFSNFLPPAGGQTLRGSFYILSNGCPIFRATIAFAFKIVLGAVRHFGLHPSDIYNPASRSARRCGARSASLSLNTMRSLAKGAAL